MVALFEASQDPAEDWHAVSHAFAAALTDVGGLALPTLAEVEAVAASIASLPAGPPQSHSHPAGGTLVAGAGDARHGAARTARGGCLIS